MKFQTLIRGLVLMGASCVFTTPYAAEKVRLLLPTVKELPSFAAFLLADKLNFYADEGLDVEFIAGRGGIDVAKQLGAGNADIGEAMGDTPIIVRPNGIPVRTVALLGGGGLMQLAVRESAGIQNLSQLKGRKVSTSAFTDTTFYALLGMLGTVGLGQNDIEAEAVGNRAAIQFLMAGTVDACACIPEQLVQATEAGVKIKVFSSSDYMPAMAQAIIASDQTIKAKPEMIRKFVRASMKAVAMLRDHPQEASKAYVQAVPGNEGKEKFYEETFRLYSRYVYAPPQSQRGATDVARLAKLQAMYLQQGVIRDKVPVEDLYTNAFISDVK